MKGFILDPDHGDGQVWVYLLATFGGGVAAAFLYKYSPNPKPRVASYQTPKCLGVGGQRGEGRNGVPAHAHPGPSTLERQTKHIPH